MVVRDSCHQSKLNVDRGWAFPYLCAATFGFILIFGISYSSAIFYVVFLEAFERSSTDTAWVVALNMCATYLTMPVGSLVSKRLGSAWTVTIGCIISSLGLMLSAFAQELAVLCFTFGFVTGLGWAIVSIGELHGVFLFFSRYRKIAVVVISIGTSTGQFVYPPFLELLFLRYGWRGTIFILSGLNLNFLVVAAILVAGSARQLKTLETESLVVNRTNVNSANSKDRFADLKEVFLLAKDPYCLLFNLSTVVASVAVGAFQTHITRASLLAGNKPFDSAMLPSAIGGSGVVGRIVWGVLAQQIRRLNVVWLTVICYGLLVFVGVTCVFIRVYAALLSSCLVFGFLLGVWAFVPEVAATVAGTARVVNAIGLNGLSCGFGILMGPPFVAWLSEADPSYRLSFSVTAVLFFVSSLLLLPSAIKSKTWTEVDV